MLFSVVLLDWDNENKNDGRVWSRQASICDLSTFLLFETKWRIIITHAEKNEANIQPSLPNKFGHYPNLKKD